MVARVKTLSRIGSNVTPASGLLAAPAVSRRFIVLYTLAQIGAFIAFIPMLNLLLPLKVAGIDPVGKAVMLSQVTLWGAIAAGLSNLAVGALSDSTRGRWGRRRPFILAGIAAVVGAHGLVYFATDVWTLVVAVIGFQVAVNLVFSPLNAVLPDRVPDRQKGLVSACQGLALPIAGLFSAAVLAILAPDLAARFAITGLAIACLLLPFALGVVEPPARGPVQRAPRISLVVLLDRDFRLAFMSRLLVQVSITLNILYLLFYLQDAAELPTGGGWQADRALGLLLATGTIAGLCTGLAGGWLSDRMGRRKQLVMLGGLMMSGGALIMCAQPQWPGPLLAQLLFGAGLGLYSTVDIALVAQVLPDPAHAGRDLGVMNLAITLPQIAAPLIGLAVLATMDGNLRTVFSVSAFFALAGGLVVLRIRRVP